MFLKLPSHSEDLLITKKILFDLLRLLAGLGQWASTVIIVIVLFTAWQGYHHWWLFGWDEVKIKGDWFIIFLVFFCHTSICWNLLIEYDLDAIRLGLFQACRYAWVVATTTSESSHILKLVSPSHFIDLLEIEVLFSLIIVVLCKPFFFFIIIFKVVAIRLTVFVFRGDLLQHIVRIIKEGPSRAESLHTRARGLVNEICYLQVLKEPKLEERDALILSGLSQEWSLWNVFI